MSVMSLPSIFRKSIRRASMRRRTLEAVDRIQCIHLTPGDVLLIKLPLAGIPPSRIKEVAAAIKDQISPLFPRNKVLVATMDISLTVIKHENEGL